MNKVQLRKIQSPKTKLTADQVQQKLDEDGRVIYNSLSLKRKRSKYDLADVILNTLGLKLDEEF